MPLAYYPKPGEILLCDFTIFVPPEMVKLRPVVVAAARLAGRGDLVTVVPLSTTDPLPVRPYHIRLTLERPLPTPFDAVDMWAKCDMVASLARSRLDRFKAGRFADRSGRRFVTGQMTSEQLAEVRCGILHGLGFGDLTKWV